jgi:hypothetical protein
MFLVLFAFWSIKHTKNIDFYLTAKVRLKSKGCIDAALHPLLCILPWIIIHSSNSAKIYRIAGDELLQIDWVLKSHD